MDFVFGFEYRYLFFSKNIIYVAHITITDNYSIIWNINNNKLNHNTLVNKLSIQNWENVINESDINTAIDNFIKQINYLINESTSKLSISAKTYKIKHWATIEIIIY